MALRDKKHLDFVRGLPCCVCGISPCDPAHIRIGSKGGMGMKPADSNVVPLCRPHHIAQHSKGERTFWGKALDAAKDLAADLFLKTGNEYQCCVAIVRFKNAFFT